MPKLDHVAIQISDMEASLAFYTEKLGFEVLFQEVDLEHREAFAFLRMEGGKLELLRVLEKEGRPTLFETPDIRPPYCPHLALASTDLDEQVDLLKRHGIPIVAGPLEIPGSVRWLYFCDPDNNVLEYVQWLADEPN